MFFSGGPVRRRRRLSIVGIVDMRAMLVYGRNSDKGCDLTDVGASAIESAINKEFNLVDVGC